MGGTSRARRGGWARPGTKEPLSCPTGKRTAEVATDPTRPQRFLPFECEFATAAFPEISRTHLSYFNTPRTNRHHLYPKPGERDNA